MKQPQAPNLSVQLPLQPRALDLNVTPRIRKRTLPARDVAVVTAAKNGPVGVGHPRTAASHTHDPFAVVYGAIEVAAKLLQK